MWVGYEYVAFSFIVMKSTNLYYKELYMYVTPSYH